MSTVVATIFLAILVPFAAIVLVACVIALANLDTYDAPTYRPPVFEQPTLVLPRVDYRPPVPPRRPGLIIDAYLGVFDAPSTPIRSPIFDAMAARYAVRALDLVGAHPFLNPGYAILRIDDLEERAS